MKWILFVILLLGVLLCVLGESSEGFNPHAAYIIMHAKKKYSKRHLIEATEKALYDKNTRLYIPKRMIVGDSVYNNDMMKTLTARLSFLRVTIGTFGRYVLAEDPSPHLPGYSVGVVINIFWTIDKSLVVSKLEKYMGIGDQCLDDKAKTALHDIFRGFDRMLPLKLKYKDRLMFVHDVKTDSAYLNSMPDKSTEYEVDMTDSRIFTGCSDYPVNVTAIPEHLRPISDVDINICSLMVHVALARIKTLY